MQRGKVPEALAEQFANEDKPRWLETVSLRIGHPKLMQYSKMIAASGIGFILGAKLRMPPNAQIGTLVGLLAVAVIIAWLANRALARAIAMQRQAIDGLRIKELNIVDMTTGKVTPAESSETNEAPTQPAPAPTKE